MKLIYYFITAICQILTVSALVTKRGTSAKDEYLVTSLPGLFHNIPQEEIPLMFSGQLELYPENKTHYYFWKYVDNHKVEKAKGKTIFWLNGGPGCSSMDGALMEAGPFRVNKQGEVTYNNGSWHKAGDIVFVDQPAGTGFSYSDDYDETLAAVVHHFIRFLEKYYELFPEDSENEIILAGESYAGQYIPYIAEGILNRNKDSQDESSKFNLKGLLIGNGWIAPNEQSLSYLPYSVQAGILKKENPNWTSVMHQHEKCQNIVNQINGGTLEEGVNANDVVSRECEQVLNLILKVTLDNDAAKNQQCVNMYDFTLKDSYPSCGMNWPPDLEYVNPFLNDKSVLNQLNVKLHQLWSECSGPVGRHLRNKNTEPAVSLLPGILEKIPIILFNGNRDIICNYIGTENFIKNLEWNGAKGFPEEAKAQDWKYEDEIVGYIRSARNLTFVNVFDASHMVPFDKPHVSRSIIDLLLGEYDEKVDEKDDDKKIIETYPLGYKKEEEQDEQENGSKPSVGVTKPDEGEDDTDSESDDDSDDDSKNETDELSLTNKNPEISNTTSRVTRLIQLLVICIIIWGVYILYLSYRARPSSIIKSGPSSKKKNVQWADQLRMFQDEDAVNRQDNSNFLSKAYNKITGHSDAKVRYTPTPSEDIEMGSATTGPDPVEFVINSDDEEEYQVRQEAPLPELPLPELPLPDLPSEEGSKGPVLK